ncbi:TonB-dependent receptor [Neolewinella persica]|uniref:TonB-dependent receptor n=1 Tax=Neolewinella persica TaxID=70998 RepID=UPI00037766EA|nr:TonB-dependent receptor [Neolewinella persica]
MKLPFLTFLFLLCTGLLAQETYLVTINVDDAETREPLSYVSLQVLGTGEGGITDETGRWNIRLLKGGYTFVASFIGYGNDTLSVTIDEPQTLNIRLISASATLSTVTVTTNDARDRLERPLMGVERLNIKQIEALPLALGEVDVFKGLQLISGVSSAGEASNGLSVRGGTIDQNLLLLDGAPLFTPTHLFGLFSIFTPDAVGSVNLYRANIPARYGGRLASVVNVQTRSPNTRNFKLQGGIGLVSSRLAVEAPLTRDGRLQVLAAGRFGFNDFLFGLVERLRNTKSRFADGSLKLRYLANDKNIFTFSGFYSKDFYQIDLLNSFGGIVATSNQYDYKTLNGTMDWLRVINDRTSFLTKVISANHNPRILFPQEASDAVIEYGSGISYNAVEASLDYRSASGHHLSGGAQLVRYDLQPGQLDPGGSPAISFTELPAEQALELTFFAEDEWTVGEALTLSAGLRYTRFSQIGPGTLRSYEPGEELLEETLVGTTEVGAGTPLTTYDGFEPRLGLSLKLTDRLRFKAAYAVTRQYLQNIYNSTTPLPTSRWLLSNQHVVPQQANLFTAGFYQLLGDKGLEFSLEGYYRKIDNLLEYKPGADFFLDPTVETDVLQGQGQAYGFELGMTKTAGAVTSSVNYTYARVRNRVKGDNFNTTVNRGEWYNGYFDQPHTFNGTLGWDDGKTHRVGFNLVVQSNRPFTEPNGVIELDGNVVPLFLERNNARLPLYHRLDFSWTIHNPHMKKSRWVGDWTFTAYNIYGHRNAYNIYYLPRLGSGDEEVFLDSPLASYKLTIFGAPIVSLSYSFKFE